MKEFRKSVSNLIGKATGKSSRAQQPISRIFATLYGVCSGTPCVMFQYRLSPVVRGAVFVVGAVVYALMTPVWGWIVDKKVNIVTLCCFLFVFISSLNAEQWCAVHD